MSNDFRGANPSICDESVVEHTVYRASCIADPRRIHNKNSQTLYNKEN